MNYKTIYGMLIESAINRTVPATYTEKHHILPRCLGGDDSTENIVRLTAREHFVSHRLLAKIYPEIEGLKIAIFLMMKNPQQGGKIVSSRGFEN